MPSLGLINVSEKDRKVLKSLLNLAGEPFTSEWQLEPSNEQADALLVDVDDVDGRAQWERFQGRHELVVAFTRRRDFKARVVLSKPIRPQRLESLLSKVAKHEIEIGVGFGNWQALNFDDPAGRLPLAEHLRRHQWNQPVSIACGNGELVIDPGAGVWFSSASDRDLAARLQQPLAVDEVRLLSGRELIDASRGLEQQSLADLKWRAGLALPGAALHPDLIGTVRFMLPNVPKQALADTAYSRQARILIRQPTDAASLLSESRADQEDVAEFLNACHICGFLLLDRENAA